MVLTKLPAFDANGDVQIVIESLRGSCPARCRFVAPAKPSKVVRYEIDSAGDWFRTTPDHSGNATA